MPRGRPSPKIAITVDPEVYERMLAVAEKAGMSVSAWMTEAARERLLIEDGLRAMAEYQEENGPFTDAERAAARAWVDEWLAGTAA